MALADLKTELKTEIAAVSGIAAANVHTYMRWTEDWNAMYTYFKQGGDDGNSDVINAWIIETMAAPAKWKPVKALKVYRDWRFRIWGMYSQDDSLTTATTFENLVEAVLNELSKFANIKVGGTAVYSDPAMLQDNAIADWGGVTVHRCEIHKIVYTIVNPNS